MSLLKKFVDQYQASKRDIANFARYTGTASRFAKMVIFLRNTADSLVKDGVGTSGIHNAANNIEDWISRTFKLLGEHRTTQKKILIAEAFQYLAKRAEDVGFRPDSHAVKTNMGAAPFFGASGDSFALVIKFPPGITQIESFSMEVGIPRGAKFKKDYRTPDIIAAGNDLQNFVLANFA